MSLLTHAVRPALSPVLPIALGLVAFIVVAFAQFELRGLVPLGALPLLVHLHGALMLSWLIVFALQAVIANRQMRSAHRVLGLVAGPLVLLIPPVTVAACIAMLRMHMAPPFFSPAFFLSLVVVEVLAFAALVGWALALRRESDWHYRLMIGATIVLMEPAVGRALPLPIIGAAMEQTIALVLQLLVVGCIALIDRRGGRKIHPATLSVAAVIVGTHLLDVAFAQVPAVQLVANALAA